MMHVYIIVANEEEKVKECIVLPDSEQDKALAVFKALKEIYGVENVAFINRRVGWLPENIRPLIEMPRLSRWRWIW